jgi:hypothetical protein
MSRKCPVPPPSGHKPPAPPPPRMTGATLGVITCDDFGAAAIQALRWKADRHDELVAVVRQLVDVLIRCDTENMPSDLSQQCTDEEWDAAIAAGKAVLAKVKK